MSKLIIALIVIVLLAIGGFFVYNNLSNGAAVDNSNTNAGTSTDTNTNTGTNAGTDSNEDVKTFVLTGENFKFKMSETENPDIIVKQGDKVRIEFSSVGGFHDWKIDEFNAATEQINDGESTFVEFVADKKGTFEYYCGVGQHRSMGMKGNFIVE